jgi:hypothetical protein
MHYQISCKYSHNSGCCRRTVAPWITVLSWHTVFTVGVLYKFTLVWYSMKQGTTHSPTSLLVHLYTHSLDLASRVQLGTWFRWPVFVMVTVEPQNIFWALSTWFWVGDSNQNFTVCFLLEFDFFPDYFLETYNDLLYLDSSVWPHSCRNLMPLRYERLLQWLQNRSKATMWLVYKITAIWGFQRCF